jgi:hypothetical protein
MGSSYPLSFTISPLSSHGFPNDDAMTSALSTTPSFTTLAHLKTTSYHRPWYAPMFPPPSSDSVAVPPPLLWRVPSRLLLRLAALVGRAAQITCWVGQRLRAGG